MGTCPQEEAREGGGGCYDLLLILPPWRKYEMSASHFPRPASCTIRLARPWRLYTSINNVWLCDWEAGDMIGLPSPSHFPHQTQSFHTHIWAWSCFRGMGWETLLCPEPVGVGGRGWEDTASLKVGTHRHFQTTSFTLVFRCFLPLSLFLAPPIFYGHRPPTSIIKHSRYKRIYKSY